MYDIEKMLTEIDCAIRSQEEKDNTYTVAVLTQCREGVKKYGKYKELEEQGLLLKLPCKVGDTVYWVNGKCKSDEHSCNRLCKGCSNLHLFVDECEFTLHIFECIGKKVFLTREEAEKALERMKGDK